MNRETFDRLHSLRMANDAVGFAMDEMRPRFERLANRHENGAAPRAVSAFQLFQTPTALAARLVESLGIHEGARVLEPSAGLGRLLDAVATRNPSEIVAVEINATLCGELYRQNRPGVRLMQRDFLEVTPEEAGAFDFVVMNPPFHMRADVRHIKHALRFGGKVGSICLDTREREEQLRPLARVWEKIPAGTFGKEGTRVPTVLAVFG